MRDDEPADRLARARVLVVDHRHLHVAAEGQRGGVPADLRAGIPREPDRFAEPLDAGADREADPVGPTCRDLDRPRPGRGDVQRRRRERERRVEVVDPGHRGHDLVELDVLPTQVRLHVAHVRVELGDLQRPAPQHLHRPVAAPQREARPAARESVQCRHRARGQQRCAKGHGDGRAHLDRRRCHRRLAQHDVRIGKQPMRLADRHAVPAPLLELPGEPADLGRRNRRPAHPPELGAHRASLRASSRSITAGTTVRASPTTPRSASSKIGAAGSLLTARMQWACLTPITCWGAPLMPTAI